MQPINGISLERYADLGAAVADITDNPEEMAKVLAAEGVRKEDYDAAVAGWTARMQDMSLMGRVAMAFQPLYQAALAKRKGGSATVAYEDFVAVSAAIKVFGWEAAIKACGVSQSDWTEAAGQWTATMGREMHRFAGHNAALEQEEARLRAGGEPKQVQVTRTQGVAPQVAAGADAARAAAAGQANPYGAAMGAGAVPAGGGNPMEQAMAAAMANPAYQQSAQAAAAIQQNPLGMAGQLVGNALTGGILPGSRVTVAWSDGNRYPAKVMQSAPGQHLVQFDNGAQHWVPENYVQKA